MKENMKVFQQELVEVVLCPDRLIRMLYEYGLNFLDLTNSL